MDVPKPPLSYAKSLAYKACNRIWNARWSGEPTCWQTRAWLPSINKDISARAMMLKRRPLSRLILVLTGHNFWRYHKFKISEKQARQGLIPWDQVVSPVCDWCTEDVGGIDLSNPWADGRPLQT